MSIELENVFRDLNGFDTHYIKPVCLGYARTRDNEVLLSQREHIFTHALLCKMYKNTKYEYNILKSFIGVLSSQRVQKNEDLVKMISKKYDWVLRAHARLSKSAQNPVVKNEMMTLYHIDGRISTGDRFQVQDNTGISRQEISLLANGQRTFAGGWCTTEREAMLRYECGRIRKSAYQRTDESIAYHVDGRTSGVFNLPKATRKNLRKNGYSNGWCLDPFEADMRSKNEWYNPAQKGETNEQH